MPEKRGNRAGNYVTPPGFLRFYIPDKNGHQSSFSDPDKGSDFFGHKVSSVPFPYSIKARGKRTGKSLFALETQSIHTMGIGRKTYLSTQGEQLLQKRIRRIERCPITAADRSGVYFKNNITVC